MNTQGSELTDSKNSDSAIKDTTAEASDAFLEAVVTCAIQQPASAAADTISDCRAAAATAVGATVSAPLQDIPAVPPQPEARGPLVPHADWQPLQETGGSSRPEHSTPLDQQPTTCPLQDSSPLMLQAARQPLQYLGAAPEPEHRASLDQQAEFCVMLDSDVASQCEAPACVIQQIERQLLQDPSPVAPQPEARVSLIQQTGRQPLQDLSLVESQLEAPVRVIQQKERQPLQDLPPVTPQLEAPASPVQHTKDHLPQGPAAAVQSEAPVECLSRQRKRQPLEELPRNRQASQDAKSSAVAEEKEEEGQKEEEEEEVHASLKGMSLWPTPAAAAADVSTKRKVGGCSTQCLIPP